MTLGDKITQLREEAKLTQEELADKIGITRAALSHYEKNRREPDYETLKKFADFFNVSTDWLLGRSPFPKEELEKRGITKIDLTEEAEKRGLTPEEVIEILDSFDALMRKHRSKFVEPKGE